MVKTMVAGLDLYKASNTGVKVRGSAALAASYVRPVRVTAFSKTRYVWPLASDNGSRYVTRKVFGKEMPNA